MLTQTYESMQIQNFGWINCDRFLDSPEPKSDLQFFVQNDSIKHARLYLVFEDLNSIMTKTYYNKMSNAVLFQNIPVGTEVELVALAYTNNSIYMYNQSLTVEEELKMKIDFQKSSEKEIDKLLSSLN